MCLTQGRETSYTVVKKVTNALTIGVHPEALGLLQNNCLISPREVPVLKRLHGGTDKYLNLSG